MHKFPKYIIEVLRRGAVGVIPTDTIYGIVGQALDPGTVERIYKLRKRNPKKPFIVLISALTDIGKFGVKLDKYRRAFLKEAWPGPVSVILPVRGEKYKYLHRGKGSIAFRVPASSELRRLLKRTGPLVAPSANWEGKKPASTVQEAQKFFGPNVEFYMNTGRVAGRPSTLIDFSGKEPVVLRK